MASVVAATGCRATVLPAAASFSTTGHSAISLPATATAAAAALPRASGAISLPAAAAAAAAALSTKGILLV